MIRVKKTDFAWRHHLVHCWNGSRLISPKVSLPCHKPSLWHCSSLVRLITQIRIIFTFKYSSISWKYDITAYIMQVLLRLYHHNFCGGYSVAIEKTILKVLGSFTRVRDYMTSKCCPKGRIGHERRDEVIRSARVETMISLWAPCPRSLLTWLTYCSYLRGPIVHSLRTQDLLVMIHLLTLYSPPQCECVSLSLS